MTPNLKKISYEKDLNNRQREAYNFQKVSALLADYGFVTIRLTSDWQGADFIAQHIDGTTFLKVQLKTSLTFAKKYKGKDIYICFWDRGDWYIFPHDEILQRVLALGKLKGTNSWEVKGEYMFATVSKQLHELFKPFRLER
ncbi:MAG: hypothetical protein ABSC47_09920 [Terracidiphilus sp.]|jgi:hypothetical protein